MVQVKEFDSRTNYKRVAQSIKTTAKDLEKMEKSGFVMDSTRIKVKVPDTNYSVVYKIKTTPNKILIVKKIIKHK